MSSIASHCAIEIPAAFLELGQRPVVLALGPHADDIELGCGATLLRLKECYHAQIHYVAFCDHYAKPVKVSLRDEIAASAAMLGCELYQGKKAHYFPDTLFPDHWQKIQAYVAKLRDLFRPSLVFAPRLDDNHQDHVVVAQAASREFRQGQTLWHYEIKQHGQDQFKPNIYVDVSGEIQTEDIDEYPDILYDAEPAEYRPSKVHNTYAHRKVFILRKCMQSQKGQPFLNTELILGTMRVRGMQMSPKVDYAEAFEGKALLY